MQEIKLTDKQRVGYEVDVYFHNSVDALINCEDSNNLLGVALHIIHILCIHIAHLAATLKTEQISKACTPNISASAVQAIENEFRLMTEYNCDKIANAERTLKDMPWEV